MDFEDILTKTRRVPGFPDEKVAMLRKYFVETPVRKFMEEPPEQR